MNEWIFIFRNDLRVFLKITPIIIQVKTLQLLPHKLLYLFFQSINVIKSLQSSITPLVVVLVTRMGRKLGSNEIDGIKIDFISSRCACIRIIKEHYIITSSKSKFRNIFHFYTIKRIRCNCILATIIIFWFVHHSYIIFLF